MKRTYWIAAAGVAGAGGLAMVAAPVIGQQQGQPIARYTMDAGTTSGMAAMGGGIGGGMAMLFGGGGDRTIHELHLRLGSTQAATGGAPKADHFMPAGAKLGKSVPLISPTPGTTGPTTRDPREPEKFQRPKGRLLIFWGCGATAPKGQPVIIDFSKLAAGQMPPGLLGLAAASVSPEWQVTSANSRTYGDWPNGRDAKPVKGDASILGEHRIAGNYSPEIKFTLAQDFLPAITGRSAAQPGGATQLSWNSVTGATGYYAWTIGFNPGADGQAQDIVWWASSATKAFGGELWDWLSPGNVSKLIGQKVVMPPSQTSCLVPAEVKKAAGEFMMGNLYAYGPQADFAYPPRPASPKTPWKPEWITRVRYRANTMWFINGPNMGAMGGAAAAESEGQQSDPQKPRKKCKGGLGGILGAATGLGC